MKKIIFIILMMFPLFIDANTLNYNDAVDYTNNYISTFPNKDKFIISNVSYGFNTNGIYDDSLFENSGMLNYKEYEIIGKKESYLYDGASYFTMTAEGNNIYIVDSTDEKTAKTSDKYLRTTNYIKEDAIVVGKGTYKNPFEFKILETVVLFNANGGSVDTESKTVAYNTKYGDLPVPTREGYKFEGWYDSQEDGKEITKDTVLKTKLSTQTLWAHWAPNGFEITLDPNGGTVSPEKISVIYNSEYGSLPIPEKLGYTFLGWYTEIDGGTKIESSTIVTNSNPHTLYAQWKSEYICEKENPFTEGTIAHKIVEDNCVFADNVYSTYVQNKEPGIVLGSKSSDTNGRGLYYTTDLTKTEDLNGDGTGERVYYFRGVVENNYLVFANFCWRIVRTNENAGVKLRYGGKYNSSNNSCPQTHEDVAAATSHFNTEDNNKKYVGYTYGSNTDSSAKKAVDNWYSNNIAKKEDSVKQLIDNVIYCNDRTEYTEDGVTRFGSYERSEPQYKCPQKSDSYTLSVSSGGINGYGNNLLKYPVALLTADEIRYAGAPVVGTETTFFLRTDDHYWTMSPGFFDGNSSMSTYFWQGQVSSFTVSYVHDILPAISLVPTANITKGTGLYNDPYIVQ